MFNAEAGDASQELRFGVTEFPRGGPGRRTTTVDENESPSVLLLQGPVGTFFTALHGALERRQCRVVKINFNAGDWLFHRHSALNFCGGLDAWAVWLDAFLRRCRPAAIVVFGDSRPYHDVAIAAAKHAGVDVWCLEEGYARPHFITCERDGNNALSPLRRPPRGDAAYGDDGVVAVQGNPFYAMALFAVPYYIARAFGAPFFPGNAHHRNRPLPIEALLWTRGLWRKLARYHVNHSFLQHLIENLEGRYYLVALQVHDDQQLLRHGRGWTMERLITEAIHSFAVHAPADRHLVFKVHPLDRGHCSYTAFVRAIAVAARCRERVHVVDDGSIGLMIRHSLGVVTVNSTSGLLALNHGRPLLALGDALYGQPGLATIGCNDDMDRFWRAPAPPDGRMVEFFMRRLRRESQVNGSFYLRHRIAATAEQIAERISARILVTTARGQQQQAS
jgi:capsular polysaccharide export protein